MQVGVLPQELGLVEQVLVLEVELLAERVQRADALDNVVLLDG